MSWERSILVEGFEIGDYCYSCTLFITGYPIQEWTGDDRQTWSSNNVVIEFVVFEDLEQYDSDGELSPIVDVKAVQRAIRVAYADSIIDAFIER